MLRWMLMTVATVVLGACASSGLVSSWTAPDADRPLRVEGAKVAAVVMTSDESLRRPAEDALAMELTARGAIGVPGYTVFPDQRPDTEQEMRAVLEREGFAGVVTMRPVSTDQQVISSPSVFAVPPYSAFWGGYYSFGWGSPWRQPVVVVAPTEVRTVTLVTIETLVYSLRQNKLLWAGRTQATYPDRLTRMVHDTARRVANALEREGLLPSS